MRVLIKTPEAEKDLEDIGLYIAQDNPAAAYKIIDKIEDTYFLLAEFPLIGRMRPDIAEDARSFAVGSFIILYRVIDGGIEIVRVVHGARDMSGLF